ncbi:MAG: NAD(P)-dependent oxidoreductase [Lachnospiraceae bacterium]
MLAKIHPAPTMAEGRKPVRSGPCTGWMSGKTLGIIGMGNIGSQVAKMAAFGLHMNVIGYNRHITGTCQTEYGTLSGNLQEVISFDFLLICRAAMQPAISSVQKSFRI